MAQRCDCCGGQLPDEPVWSAHRDEGDTECTGSIDPETDRCRAWVDDTLWEESVDSDQSEEA